jgi:hypothetical protein
MSATATTPTTDLSEKQRRILAYLHEEGRMQTYFKSRLIGEALAREPLVEAWGERKIRAETRMNAQGVLRYLEGR